VEIGYNNRGGGCDRTANRRGQLERGVREAGFPTY